jgi:hypothetical protein
MMWSQADDLHQLFGLLMTAAHGFLRVPSFQTPICLPGTRRTKEIVELVHQSALIRAGDGYLARLPRDRAGRDERGVLP